MSKTQSLLAALFCTATLAGCSSSTSSSFSNLSPAEVAGVPVFTRNTSNGIADLPAYASTQTVGGVGRRAITRNFDGRLGNTTIVSQTSTRTVIDVDGTQYTFSTPPVSGGSTSDDTRLGMVDSQVMALNGQYVKGTALISPSTEKGFFARAIDVAISMDGGRTPVTSLPAQATYFGSSTRINSSESVATPEVNVEVFQATATFGTTNRINGTIGTGFNPIDISGTISGNTFEADIAQRVAPSIGVEGTIEGGFFGPNAEEIGAVGSGTDGINEDFVIGLVGRR